jgi:shikimate dehydrogenase
VRLLGAGQVVADLVYEPIRTALLDAAAAAGCRTVDGLGMLLHQAALAFESWTGEAAPLDAMRGAIAAHLRDPDISVSS